MNTTCLYQLPAQSSCQMMSYVLRTAAGRLIVMDGGCRADADALLALLEKLAGPRPAVEAWFLTHAHDDHIGALTELLENKRCAFSADRILCNFPSHEWLTSHDAGGHALQCLPNLVQIAGSRISRVAADDRFVIDDMTFQVLRVPDLQITANAVNNSSVVFRLTVDKGRSVLFTGDLGEELCRQRISGRMWYRWPITASTESTKPFMRLSPLASACGPHPIGCGKTTAAAVETAVRGKRWRPGAG